MIFDDIGSFPLPYGITRDWIECNLRTKEYEELVKRTFLMKSKYVELPNYPQFRDMISMFMNLIKNPEFQDEPYLISKKYAIIPELEYVERLEAKSVRVCITGAFELYYNEFGGVIYEDILLNLAESVARFAKNACKYENVKCISLDEPSLGIATDLQPSDEVIRDVFNTVDVKVDVQIHLHQPTFYEKILETSVDVIGVECASKPENMDFLDKELIDSHEKKLRIGIARTDIDNVIAEFNAKHNVNAWKNDELIVKAVDEIESPEVILKRIENAYNKFNDLIAYVGPDCGLFSFPNQESAIQLLKNVKIALERFRGWIT